MPRSYRSLRPDNQRFLIPAMLSGVVLALLALFVLLWSISPALANVGPPRDAQGRIQKFVNHLVRFDDMSRYAKEYRFYVVGRWRDAPDSITALTPDRNGEIHYNNISPLAQKNGVYLYAVPRTLPLKPDGDPDPLWFSDTQPGVLKSSRLENAIRYNPMSDPRDTYRTRYKVVIKEIPAAKGAPAGKSLQIALVRSGWDEPQAALLLGLPIIALYALVGRLRPRSQEQEK
jgi:hypothetical protein